MQIRYYGDKISNRIARTPEGFLICQDVPISRTGYQEYLASEIMENPTDGNKIIPVFRPANEVFDIRSLASFEGKPVTNEHPDEDVTPDNYTRYACGHVQNVHPGDGEDKNKVLADLYITDPSLINSILNGKREISCGYYAEEKRDSSGKLCQTKIRGNHVAVVNSGRAGSKVRIRDKRAVCDYSEDELFEDACGYEDEDDMLDDDEVYVEDLVDGDDELIEDYGVKGMKHTGGFQKGNQYRFKAGNQYRFQKRGDDDEELVDDEDDMINDYSEEELFEDEDLDAIEGDELEVIEDDDEFIDDDDEELIKDYGVKGMKKGQHVMEGKHVKEEPRKGGMSTGKKIAAGAAALGAGALLGTRAGRSALRTGALMGMNKGFRQRKLQRLASSNAGIKLGAMKSNLGERAANVRNRVTEFGAKAGTSLSNAKNRVGGAAENFGTKASRRFGEIKKRFKNSDPESGALFDDDIMINSELEDCGMYDDDELMDACGGKYSDDDLFEDDDLEVIEDEDEIMAEGDDEEFIGDDGEELLAEDDDDELMEDDDFEEIEDDDDEMINDYSEEELFEDDDDEIMAEDDDEEFIGDDDFEEPVEDDDDELINDYSEEELFEDDDFESIEDDDLEDPIGDDDEEIDAIVSDDDDEIMEDDDEEFIGDDDDFEPSVEDDDELDAIEDDELEDPIVDDDEEVIEDDDGVDVIPTDEVEQKMAQGSTLDTRKDAALREIVNATRGISNAQERKSVQDAIYKAFCGKSQMGEIMKTIERNARSKRDSMAKAQTQMSAKGQQAIYDSFNPHKQSGK